MGVRVSQKAEEERFSAFFDCLVESLDGVTNPPTDTAAFALSRLRDRCRKRAAIRNAGLEEKALSAFLLNNDSVKSFQVELPDAVRANAQDFILRALWRASDSFGAYAPQTVLHVEAFMDLWRFGPGASVGVEGTHAAEKLVQPFTCTAGSKNLVKYIRANTHYLRAYDGVSGVDGIRVVPGSRLSFVPKNEETVRTIATEPSGNMLLQLSAGAYLERALKLVGLDITTQQAKNRLLCSVGVDYGLCTIDLKSASDRISIDLVRQLLPREWVELLMAIRSPYTTLPDKRVVELGMISTMGNGTTFPLMTLIIAALIYGYRCCRGGPARRIDWSQTAVFGDDIIVSSAEYDEICDILTRAGFVINHDKSFKCGYFRESCGLDTWLGADVTPFYVKGLASPAAVYVAINQLVRWCTTYRIELVEPLRLLLGWLPGRKPFFVPQWSDPSSGIRALEVQRCYKMLRPVTRRVRLSTDSGIMVALAAGGYLVGGTDDSFYIPRADIPRYVVVRRKMPSGFSTGWDPVWGSMGDAVYAQKFLSKA